MCIEGNISVLQLSFHVVQECFFCGAALTNALKVQSFPLSISFTLVQASAELTLYFWALPSREEGWDHIKVLFPLAEPPTCPSLKTNGSTHCKEGLRLRSNKFAYLATQESPT